MQKLSCQPNTSTIFICAVIAFFSPVFCVHLKYALLTMLFLHW